MCSRRFESLFQLLNLFSRRKMARNAEKAMTALARWRRMKEEEERVCFALLKALFLMSSGSSS